MLASISACYCPVVTHPGVRTFDVEGVPVPAASVADLIESKRTRRLQDAADIEILEEIQQRLGA